MQAEAKPGHYSAILAPPPSPIPTGKGSRSAADETFVRYLEKSSLIPELTLPANLDRLPSIVDFGLLTSNDRDSIEELVKSAGDMGAFLISGHGISPEEARSSLQEAERSLAVSSRHDVEFDGSIPILRGSSREGTIAWRTELAQSEDYRIFSKCIEQVACKLDRIAKEAVRVISRVCGDTEFPADEWEATLRIHRHVRGNRSKLDKNLQKDQESDSGFALRVILPVEQYPETTLRSETEGGSVIVHSRPDTVVVTCGKQLEEWSHGELKAACSSEPDFQPGTSLHIEYECSLVPTPPRPRSRNSRRRLSVADQVLIVLVISFAVKFLADVRSWLV